MTLSGCQGAPSAAPLTRIVHRRYCRGRSEPWRSQALGRARGRCGCIPRDSQPRSPTLRDLDHRRHFFARTRILIVAEPATARDHDFGQRAASIAVTGVVDHARANRRCVTRRETADGIDLTICGQVGETRPLQLARRLAPEAQDANCFPGRAAVKKKNKKK